MNLKKYGIILNGLLLAHIIFMVPMSNSYAVVLPLLSMALVGIFYLVYWLIGNIAFFSGYEGKDRKLVLFLLNFPMAVTLSIVFMSWASDQPANFAYTLNVMDEKGSPVADAKVTFGRAYRDDRLEHTEDVFTTDKDGNLYRQHGPIINADRATFFRISKQGYYPSYGHAVGLMNYLPESYKTVGTWPIRYRKPWNPTFNVVLKKIVDPVPLYVNQMVNLEIRQDSENAYDMLVGDWVAPRGKGVTKDLIIEIAEPKKRDNAQPVTLIFPGDGNGIQKIAIEPDNHSLLKLPHHAPENGYENRQVVINYGAAYVGMKEQKQRDSQNYFFRIRSNATGGKLPGALYGKIMYPFSFSYSSTYGNHVVNMKYYLNPVPGNTNLEFDVDKNLIENSTHPYWEMLKYH